MTNIYTFWYNPGLNNIPDYCAMTSLRSMLQSGATVTIYTYGKLNGVEDLVSQGLIIESAEQWLPHDEWFTADYGALHGFAFMSDVIRYKILQHKEGWWVDTDVLIVDDINKAISSSTSVAFAFERWKSDGTALFNGALLYSDGSNHKFFRDALEYCDDIIKHKKAVDSGDHTNTSDASQCNKWGIIGPLLISDLAIEFKRDPTVQRVNRNSFYFNQYFQNDLSRWVYNPIYKGDADLLKMLTHSDELLCIHLWYSAVDWSKVHSMSMYGQLMDSVNNSVNIPLPLRSTITNISLTS